MRQRTLDGPVVAGQGEREVPEGPAPHVLHAPVHELEDDPALDEGREHVGRRRVPVAEGQGHHPAGVAGAQAVQGPGLRPLLDQGADEASRGGVLRRGEHVVRVPELDHPPGLHHGHPVGQGPHDLHLVGDEHDRHAQLLVDPAQQGQHLGGRLRVQRAGGLVGQQDARTRRQRPGDADALLLPAGELLDVRVRLVGQADEVQQLGDAGLLLCLGHAGDLQRVGDVAPHGARGHQVELLEDHPDVAAHLPQVPLGETADLAAGDDHRAGGGPVEGVDQPQQRRLPGPGVADHAEDLARVDGQVHVPEGVHRLGVTGPGREDATDTDEPDQRLVSAVVGRVRRRHVAPVSPSGRGCRTRPSTARPAGPRPASRA